MKQLIENSRCSLAEQIDKKIEILTSTLFELRTENDHLKKILEQTQKQVKSLEEESQSLRVQCAEQKEQINVLEQYSRRESIRVLGIQGDRKEEIPAECEKNILHMIQHVLGLTDIDSAKISTLHRVGRVMTNEPRPVIIKFVSRKDRDQVIKTRNRLKGSNVVITEDLTKLNLQRLNRLRQHDGVLDAWSAAGGRLFVKLIDLSIMEIKNGDTNPIEKKLLGVTREQQRQSREPNRQQRYRQGEQQRQQDQRQHHQRSGQMGDDRHGASPSRSHFSPTTYSTPSTTWIHAPKPVLETDMVLHQHDTNKEQQPSASDVSNIDMENTSRTLDNPLV
ncbi:protein unc-13 homolog C-like [Pomacea canaliculata]|uniref:protein unc-13 homolog C-like n=1 Tax=Pomacea canaliculata TaxID=400727 RepID=UPI000D72FA9F|nr:protein unc-13 homolog C-like [Pomacea canaliculata]